MADYTISEAEKNLIKTVDCYLKEDKKGRYVLAPSHRNPPLLLSSPGIGKTETVKRVAEKLGIGFCVFNLTHYSRSTFNGLPVVTQEEDGSRATETTRPEILAGVEREIKKGFSEGILLLDEFTSTPESIMPMMLAFLQTGYIGNYKLSDGWIVVLCGNPPKFNKSARELDPATFDRVRILNIDVSLEAFLNYGEDVGMHPSVLEFIGVYPSFLYRYERSNDKTELVTCRGWHRLSENLQIAESLGHDVDRRMIAQFLKSDEIAIAFEEFYRQYEPCYSQNLEKILNGTAGDDIVKKFRGYNVRDKWKKLDNIKRMLVTNYGGCLDNSEEQAALAKALDNVIAFAAKIDDSGLVKNRLMDDIDKEESFVKAMGRHHGANYTEYCHMKYRLGA